MALIVVYFRFAGKGMLTYLPTVFLSPHLMYLVLCSYMSPLWKQLYMYKICDCLIVFVGTVIMFYFQKKAI